MTKQINDDEIENAEASNEENESKVSDSQFIKCQKERDEYLVGWKRALADYDNLKKETARRQSELVEYQRLSFLEEVFPVYDHFKTAISHIPEEQKNQDWAVGLSHIQKMFQGILRENGVEEIKTVGEQFDHNLHNAVGEESNKDFANGVIIKEVSGGYKAGERIMRHAKVVVNKITN